MKKFINLISIILISIIFFSFSESKKSNTEISKSHKINELIQNSSFSGTCKRTKWGLYSAFEFKGKSTVIFHSFGLEYTASYIQDGKLVRIENGKSGMLLLEIKDKSTMIGQGVAKGIYMKK